MVSSIFSCCKNYILEGHDSNCPNHRRNLLAKIRDSGQATPEDIKWMADKLIEVLDRFAPQVYQEDD